MLNLDLALWLFSLDWHFNFFLFGDIQTDGVVDKLRVLLDEVLDLGLISELKCVFLQVKGYAGSATERVTAGILRHKELVISGRSPDMLFIVLILRRHNDLVGDEVRRVETNTELADHRHR